MNNWLSKHEIQSLFRMAMLNAWRWKTRLLSIALLIAFSLSLFIMQGGSALIAEQENVANITYTTTRHYDALVVPLPSQPVLSLSQLPAPKFQRQIYQYGESAALMTVGTGRGELRVIGVNPQTQFFLVDRNSEVGSNLDSTNYDQLALQSGELLLAQREATRLGLRVGDILDISYQAGLSHMVKSFVITAVGELGEHLDAVLRLNDLVSLNPALQPNCFLINYDKEQATLEYLVEWMSDVYPNSLIYSDLSAPQLASSVYRQLNQASSSILMLIVLFVFISIFTIVFVTFLERRQEYSTLKSVGIDQRQVSMVFGFEYGIAILGGLIGFQTLMSLLSRLWPWYRELSTNQLVFLYFSGYCLTIIIILLVLSYPLQLLRRATVMQLMLARTIPLGMYQINSLNSSFQYLLREEDEGVRLLKVPAHDGKLICICTKQVGDTVKQGEVIAVHEEYGGLVLMEWSAVCDGVVVDISPDSGLVAIKPLVSEVKSSLETNEQTSSWQELREAQKRGFASEERRRLNRLEAARQRVRDQNELQASIGQSKTNTEGNASSSSEPTHSELAFFQRSKVQLDSELEALNNTRLTRKNSLIILAVLAIIGIAFLFAPRELSYAEKWRYDLQYIKLELPTLHPNLYAKMSEDEFLERMDNLIAKVYDNTPEMHIAGELKVIINDLGDGHTQIDPWRTERGLAVKFFLFEDGVYAIDCHIKFADIYGKRVTAVNEVPIDQVLERLKPYVPRENIYLEKSKLGEALADIYLLKLAGILESGLTVRYSFDEESYFVDFGNTPRATSIWLSDTSDEHLVLTKSTQNYSYSIIDEETLYVHYKSCLEMETYPFAKFLHDILTIIDNSPIERLIIDLRDNQGGDSRLIEPFIQAISERSQFASPENLKVIIGRQSFSSSLFAIMQFKLATGAEFIGEPTGSYIDHYGFPSFFDLPNLPYRLVYATQYFEFSQRFIPELGTAFGNRAHIEGQMIDAIYPDIEVDLFAADWFQGDDAFLLAALR